VLGINPGGEGRTSRENLLHDDMFWPSYISPFGGFPILALFVIRPSPNLLYYALLADL
jgi:hypothetical protein